MADNNINYPVAGLNLNSTNSSIQKGELTYALNAVLSGFSGDEVVYQPEASNRYDFKFPDNCIPIGVFNITQLGKIIFFVYSEEGKHHIGAYEDGSYSVVIESECLDFSKDRPIHQVVCKVTNCSTELYWADKKMRFLDLDDLPWLTTPDPNNEFKPFVHVGVVDCNKLSVQPVYSIPSVSGVDVVEGGVTKEGSYAFAIQYANSTGESYGMVYGATTYLPIKDHNRSGQVMDAPTSKAVRVRVSDLDTTGVFTHFNLIAFEVVNGIHTSYVVGTYPITGGRTDVLFTGDTSTMVKMSMEEIFRRHVYYETAEGVTVSDSRVIWYGLRGGDRVNYQDVFSRINLKWCTTKVPYDNQNGYTLPDNVVDYTSYMRDEVYPLLGVFELANGTETDMFPFIGRAKKASDGSEWMTKNTASVLQTYNNAQDYGVYQVGDFAYWESEERYPTNPEVWGSLAGANIRHFKFPDEVVSKRFSSEGGRDYVYPVGVYVDMDDVRNAIEMSNISSEHKSEIVGIKILRGDRSTGNMSVVAKGHFTNVGKYTYKGSDYYYANYPYNDVGDDPLFATSDVKPLTGANHSLRLRGFESDESLERLVFHSPDTHFTQPYGVDSGYVKLEAIDYGSSKHQIVPIKNNAEYKFSTKDVVAMSIGLAVGVGFDYSRNGKPEFNTHDAFSVFDSNKELLEKLIPYTNFGYNINSVAEFNKSYAVPYTENKIFPIDFGKYLNSEYNSIDEGRIINNLYRESSVFVKLREKLRYAHEYNHEIPVDNSRITAIDKSELDDITFPEFIRLLIDKNENAIRSSLLGLTEVVSGLAPDSENLQILLYQYLGRLMGPIVVGNTPDQILAMVDASDDCGTSVGRYLTVPDYSVNSGMVIPQLITIDYALNAPFSNTVEYPAHSHILNISEIVRMGGIYSNTNIEVTYYPDIYKPVQTEIDYVYNDVLQQMGGSITNEESEDFFIKLVSVSLVNRTPVTRRTLCGGDLINAISKALYSAYNYYRSSIMSGNARSQLSTIRHRDVNAYYGSIKRLLPAQWGDIFSYDVVGTGKSIPIDVGGSISVYGGDTFINKFSFKTKLSVFDYNTVGIPDSSDVALDEFGMLGHPIFYISTKPYSYDYKFNNSEINTALSGLGLVNRTALTGGIMISVGSIVMSIGGVIAATGIGVIVGVIVAAIGGIISLIGTILNNVRSKLTRATINLYKTLFQQILDNLGVKNINLDMAVKDGLLHRGLFYQYVYGIPSYFVESAVNVDYRNALNDLEGNFYPRVGSSIPNDWLQQDNVPISYDNIYSYNKSYSKQLKEVYYPHLPLDWDPLDTCQNDRPNRAIWSMPSNLDETFNNWLIYKPKDYFDFPKEYGKLTSLDGILNNQVLARFENKTLVYNAMSALKTDSTSVFVGQGDLFTGTPPLDIMDTDIGYLGSQHKFLLKTPFGNVFTDAIRGLICLMNGNTPIMISDKKMSRWFINNLPIKIKDFIPDVNIDAAQTGVGITGVYDDVFKRVLITKKDYVPLRDDIDYRDGDFYIGGDKVSLDDSRYFEDVSFTISFSFMTGGCWVSYHSYHPNMYVPNIGEFSTVTRSDFYTHNVVYDSFLNFNGVSHAYVVEYPYFFGAQSPVVQAVNDVSTARIYTSVEDWYEPNELLYYNKAIVYNNNQSSGVLELEPRDGNDMRSRVSYPRFNSGSITIPVSKFDEFVSFNMFWDVVRDKSKPIMVTDGYYKTINQDNMVYENTRVKGRIKGNNVRVRMILDKENVNYKILTTFVVVDKED